MPEGARARLVAALRDYVSSYTGDGGRSPRGEAPGVSEAQSLLSKLEGSSSDTASTPGQRARKRAEGGQGRGGPVADRAVEMLGGTPKSRRRGRG